MEEVLVEYVTDVEVEAVVVVELDWETLVDPVTDEERLVEAEILVDPVRLVLVDWLVEELVEIVVLKLVL